MSRHVDQIPPSKKSEIMKKSKLEIAGTRILLCTRCFASGHLTAGGNGPIIFRSTDR